MKRTIIIAIQSIYWQMNEMLYIERKI